MPETITVLLAFRIADESIERIKALDPRIRVLNDWQISGRSEPDPETKARILRDLGEADVILGPNSMAMEYFNAATQLKWFQAVNAGIDNMDRAGLLKRGFTVTTAAGLAAGPIAEYVIGVMVMLAKSLHVAVRQQQEHRWQSQRVAELAGKTLGIVGLGEIGRETAKRARAFDMRVIATRRSVGGGANDPDADELFAHSDIDRLCAESDYVVVAVPLTTETKHLIGAPQFAKMKPTASIVNIARGPVVDQQALIAALQDGTIASAALDVFDVEPLPADSPLWDMPNVIVTPHFSGSVEGYGHKATELFLANLQRYLAGEALSHEANPSLGY
ncbi:MAG: D-2-hydroxyacid dehydrogenase [Tepidiformaceae bacterium]